MVPLGIVGVRSRTFLARLDCVAVRTHKLELAAVVA